MQWRTRLKRLTASEKHEVINDIFGGETEYNKFYDAVSVAYRIAEFIFLAAALSDEDFTHTNTISIIPASSDLSVII